MQFHSIALIRAAIALAIVTGVLAQDAGEYARGPASPAASLLRVPFPYGADFAGITKAGGTHLALNVEPVIPFELDVNWNVITNVILPWTSTQDIFPRGRQGDTALSAFSNPRDPGEAGIVRSSGPAVWIPGSTNAFVAVTD